MEYESINAGITAGIVIAIILPMIICIAGVAYCFYKNREKDETWEFNIPRSRSSSRAKINDPALYSRELSPNESPDRVQSPVSDISSLGSNNKVKRSYDRTYKTNEPLPGKPDIEWEEKDWDISPEGSDFGKNYNKTQDPDYIYVEEPNTSRTDTLDSGLGYEKIGRPYTMYEDFGKEDSGLQKADSRSQPILNYGTEDYASVKKAPKISPKEIPTFSSKSTAV